jgi:hypothetical protein
MPLQTIFQKLAVGGVQSLHLYFGGLSADYIRRSLLATADSRAVADACELLSHVQFAVWADERKAKRQGQLKQLEQLRGKTRVCQKKKDALGLLSCTFDEIVLPVRRARYKKKTAALTGPPLPGPGAADTAMIDRAQLELEEAAHRAARKRQQTQLRHLNKVYHAGRRVAMLMNCYGPGVVMMQKPVLRMKRLLEISNKQFKSLQAALNSARRFGQFAYAVSAAMEAAVIGTGGPNDVVNPIRNLSLFAEHPTDANLTSASATWFFHRQGQGGNEQGSPCVASSDRHD